MKGFWDKSFGLNPGRSLWPGLVAWGVALVVIAAFSIKSSWGGALAVVFLGCVLVWFAGLVHSFADLVRGYRGRIPLLAFGVNLLPLALLFVTAMVIGQRVHDSHRVCAYNAAANADAHNAYAASQSYFLYHPNGKADLDLLKECGFQQSAGVVVQITDGRRETLSIDAAHQDGGWLFRVDALGRIVPEEK